MTNPFQRVPLPAAGEFWKRPEFKAHGDSNPDSIFLNVGQFLSAYEQIEFLLAKMFGLFVEAKSDAAERAFGSITSPKSRRQALGKATEIFASLHRDFFSKDDFAVLLKHLEHASNLRNEIAHGTVKQFEGKGYFLCPAPYNSSKTDPHTLEWWEEVRNTPDPFKIFGDKYRYTSGDLEHFRNRLATLMEFESKFFMEHVMSLSQKNFDNAPPHQKASIRITKQD